MNNFYNRYYVYIKPVIKNPYVKNYASLVFSLIAVAFFGFFAIRPTFKTIVGLIRDIDQQKQILATLNQKSQRLDKTLTNYASIDEDTKLRLNSLVPDKIALASFMKQLENLANKNAATISGLQFQQFEIESNPKPTTNKADLKEVSFTFSIRGSYFAIVNILNSLNSLQHLIKIDSAGLTKNESGLTLTINGKTIY